MSELKEKILAVLRRPQFAGIATVTEDGKPWVRYVMAVADENLTLRSACFLSSRKVAQVAKNPEVHLMCGVTSLENMSPYFQIQTRAEVTNDESERHAYWCDELANIFDGPDDPRYRILIMRPYRIEMVSPPNMAPEVWEG